MGRRYREYILEWRPLKNHPPVCGDDIYSCIYLQYLRIAETILRNKTQGLGLRRHYAGGCIYPSLRSNCDYASVCGVQFLAHCAIPFSPAQAVARQGFASVCRRRCATPCAPTCDCCTEMRFPFAPLGQTRNSLRRKSLRTWHGGCVALADRWPMPTGPAHRWPVLFEMYLGHLSEGARRSVVQIA